MNKAKSILAILIATALVLTAVSFVLAQRGERTQMQRRQFDPEEMLARSLERIMEQMKMSEDEAAVLKPMIETIMRTRMEQAQKQREAFQTLNDALEAKDTEKIEAGLNKVKTIRKENKEKSDKMEKELVELLTLEQEAQLTVLGVVNSDGGMGMGIGFRGGSDRPGGPGGPGGFGGNRQRR